MVERDARGERPMSDADGDNVSASMAAQPDDPRINVFCPRAGLCAYEQDRDDEEEERPRRANVNYLPMYNRDELERQLKRSMQWLWGSLLGGMVGTSLLGILSKLVEWSLPFVLMAGMVAGLGFFAAIMSGYYAFVRRQCLQIYERAQPRLPDARSQKPEGLHWCELLAAGFTPVRPNDRYVDQGWKLAGKPKTVLIHGDLRIPVFRYRGDSDRIDRHFARMAAYCHLLQVCEGFKSPYGIVLWAGTYRAMSVPNCRKSRGAFHETLRVARGVIHEARQKEDVPPEPTSKDILCENCPLGRPQVVLPGRRFIRHGKPLPIYELGRIGDSSLKYHSHCGDRFQWRPPYEKTERMGLQPARAG